MATQVLALHFRLPRSSPKWHPIRPASRRWRSRAVEARFAHGADGNGESSAEHRKGTLYMDVERVPGHLRLSAIIRPGCSIAAHVAGTGLAMDRRTVLGLLVAAGYSVFAGARRSGRNEPARLLCASAWLDDLVRHG